MNYLEVCNSASNYLGIFLFQIAKMIPLWPKDAILSVSRAVATGRGCLGEGYICVTCILLDKGGVGSLSLLTI